MSGEFAHAHNTFRGSVLSGAFFFARQLPALPCDSGAMFLSPTGKRMPRAAAPEAPKRAPQPPAFNPFKLFVGNIKKGVGPVLVQAHVDALCDGCTQVITRHTNPTNSFGFFEFGSADEELGDSGLIKTCVCVFFPQLNHILFTHVKQSVRT